jgi:hypothetical protein
VIGQRFAPIGRLDVGGREDILAQRTVGHRVEQIVLFAEVPVDARHPDAEMLAEQRHAQVIDRDLFSEVERTADDVVGIDGSAFAPLTLLRGCWLGHCGHLHHVRRFAADGLKPTGSCRLICGDAAASPSPLATVIPIVGFLIRTAEAMSNRASVVIGSCRRMGLVSAPCLADDDPRVAIIARSRADLDPATQGLSHRGEFGRCRGQ